MIYALFLFILAALAWHAVSAWQRDQPRNIEDRLMREFRELDEFRGIEAIRTDPELLAALDERELALIDEAFRLGMGHTITASVERHRAARQTQEA